MADLIERSKAIDALNDVFTITGRANAVIVQDYIRRVNNRLHDLPSAQPEKIGRDIRKTSKRYCEFKCSVCNGEVLEFNGHGINYCPYCGAKMEK